MTTVSLPVNTRLDLVARYGIREPVSADGFIDAAWWLRSCNLIAGLPAFLPELWSTRADISAMSYNLDSWDPAP